MIKKTIVVLLILLISISVLAGYQWLTYEKKAVNTPIKTQVQALEIVASIIHDGGNLEVEQTISNLKQPSFMIKLPSKASSLTCIDSTEEECSIIKDGTLHRISVNGASSLAFSYKLPINSGQSSVWLDDWAIRFYSDSKEELYANYQVTLSDAEKMATWIAGALNNAEVEREHLDYYAWSKKESKVFPIYMTKDLVEKQSDFEPKLTLYTINNNSISDHLPSLQNWHQELHNKNRLTIVQSSGNELYFSSMLMVVPQNIEFSKVEELAIKAYILSNNQPVSEEIAWLWNVLPSFVLNRPVGNDKVFEMSSELVDKLPEKPRTEFATWLLSPRKNGRPAIITLTDLDSKLSKAANLSTVYFTENGNINESNVPLFFYDSRPVYYGNKKLNKDWGAIERDKIIYLPLKQTLESLYYKVNFVPEQQAFVISKDENSWSLYLNKTFFTYNQDDYRITSEPLLYIGKDVFIAEKWLEEILRIEVIKRDNVIYLR